MPPKNSAFSLLLLPPDKEGNKEGSKMARYTFRQDSGSMICGA